MLYDISVIIPMYNAAGHIYKTLNSIEQQSFKGKIEVLCIDDCSTDTTAEVVSDFSQQSKHSITLVHQEKNMRQGTARNRGLELSKGKFVFFLDSDDFIDPNTLEKMNYKAETDQCDFVLCDWTFYYEETGEHYVNNDLFLQQTDLIGEQCELLYQSRYYFTVNKLYNTHFLQKNNIKFGEGYIYEDFEFYVDVVQKANHIGIVSNPYYKVRVNELSVTKTNYTTSLHMKDFHTAVKKTLSIFEPRHEESFYMVYKYFFERCLLYADRRMPRKYKQTMIEKTVSLLNDKKTDFYCPSNVVLENQLYFKRNLIQNNKIRTIMFVHKLSKKKLLRRFYKVYVTVKSIFSVKRWIHKLKQSKINKRRRIRAINKIKKASLAEPLKNKVLFLGFDYRYIGNSKYLYDYMKEHHPEIQISMVTKDKRIPEEDRIPPRSASFWKALGKSKVIITESWTPLPFYKKDGALWIQLWHGTPYKKMLFDSPEKYISKYNRNHKRNKKRDIEKWDILIADSRGAVDLFSSAFSKGKSKIKYVGYPRVQWLKDQQENVELKKRLKQQLSIQPGQKVLLYAPTWRDYNFKNPLPDLDYLLDTTSFIERVGPEYVLITKLHTMERGSVSHENIINAPSDLETQELLLITDVVISDYSSIIFDVLPFRKKIALYTNDRNQFNEARGTYEAIDQIIKPFSFDNEEELKDFVKSPMTELQVQHYDWLLNTYGNVLSKNSNASIVDMIASHMKN